jgi:hypothetical protein
VRDRYLVRHVAGVVEPRRRLEVTRKERSERRASEPAVAYEPLEPELVREGSHRGLPDYRPLTAAGGVEVCGEEVNRRSGIVVERHGG